MKLTVIRTYGSPGVIAQFETTATGADGSFVFENILSGDCQISWSTGTNPADQPGATDIPQKDTAIHATTLKPGLNRGQIGTGERPAETHD